MSLNLQSRYQAKKTLKRPSSVSGAYGILNGSQMGDIEGAQIFLNSMSETERILRGRGEQRENTRERMFSKSNRYPSLLKKKR